MKKITLLILLIIAVDALSAQKLLDIYKKGTVKLIPDEAYGKDNDWDKVFETWYDTLYNKPMGNRKSLKILPDGSVVIDHAYRNYFSLFSPDGNFIKEFGITNNKGERFVKTQGIAGIVNNNMFFSNLNNMGKMLCFDFEGNYKKSLHLDYMSKQMIALPNNKIAVVGWVIWEKQFRDFVALVDYETNEEKIIWNHFTDRCEPDEHCKLFNYYYVIPGGGAVMINTMPFTNSTGSSAPPQIALVDMHLIIAYPENGEIVVCDLEGNIISKNKIKNNNNFLSVEEQKDIQRQAIEKNKKSNKFAHWVSEEELQLAVSTLVGQMEADLEKISEPIPLPYFSTMIKDSDDNLLLFDFPKEVNQNRFNVWIMKNGGEFVTQSTFVCDDYELEINPSKMVFHDGYLYGLQKLKNAEGVPLRLQRFKLE